jgi:competence protein ComEA
MHRCPQARRRGVGQIPTVRSVRERKSADEAVAQRLRSVLAGPVRGDPDRVVQPSEYERGLAELAVVGEPLDWSDIIPAWPEDVDLDDEGAVIPGPGGASSSAASPPSQESPAGSAWATPPGVVSRGGGASPGSADPPPVLRPAATDSSRPERRPLPPPAWVLPEGDEPHPPIPSSPSTSSSYAFAEDEPAELTGAGAFGGDAEGGRRFGLRAFDPGRRGARALAVVAALVVVIAAVMAWRARPQVDSVAPPAFDVTASAGDAAGGGGPAGAAGGGGPVGDAAGGGPGGDAAGGGTAAAMASGPAEVVVAVGGKVRKPGLVRLPGGSRVADAIDAAGGADPGVDVALLNLARKVVDGELILVGVTPPPGAVVATGPAAGGSPAPGAPVNLNTATLSELDGLPGVGPVLAQRILDARAASGGFKSVGDLRKVDGIGDARYEQLKDLVTV